ncbi:MAG: NAD-dependent epimerase/dehydratase family protein [Myxococcaceae bacterium]|nr:NAD-dependent epimerase/dehydratase family protein [Myxococcaceae bacterium]
MKVLIIGGTRFVGYLLAWRLLVRGDEVTLLNRGNLPDPFGDRVQRLRVDRTTPDFVRALDGQRFDATVDFAAYDPRDVRTVIDSLGDRVGHYVFISTGQVYLVRQEVPRPAKETDFDGPLMPEPNDPAEHHEWEYGMKKRGCEEALVAASQSGFKATRIRIPMVNGERDYLRRIESYLWRMVDGGPILLPDGGREIARHVYGVDVAIALATLLGDERTYGKAYNLCQDEAPTVFDLLGMLIDLVGSPDNRVPVPRELFGELPDRQISPFSQARWMSLLDPGLARHELGFHHRPLGVYLNAIVASFFAHPPASPPENYVRYRAAERELAKKVPGYGD